MERRTKVVAGLLGMVVLVAAPEAVSAGPGRLGAEVAAGVPDGASGGVVWRPFAHLRLHGGVAHNLVAPGVRGGVTLLALRTAVTPSLTLEAGQFAEGDARELARVDSPMLERVGYRFASAHLGLEVGRERFTFYVHAGLSKVSGELHGLDEEIAERAGPDAPEIRITDPTITLTGPSARAGLILFF